MSSRPVAVPASSTPAGTASTSHNGRRGHCLSAMTRKIIAQRIHQFDTFGDTPFPVVRLLLEQCSQKKLWSLEEQSPHFVAHTGYIWKRHCLRDFKEIEKLYQSGSIKRDIDWRALYEAKESTKQEAIGAAAARIKDKYATLHADREANKVRAVNGTIPTSRRGRGGLVSSSSRGKAVSPGSMTTGQRLLSNARKRGNAKMQLTAPPPPPPPRKITTNQRHTMLSAPVHHIDKKMRISDGSSGLAGERSSASAPRLAVPSSPSLACSPPRARPLGMNGPRSSIFMTTTKRTVPNR